MADRRRRSSRRRRARFLIDRLVHLTIVVLLVSFAAMAFLELAPGDPALVVTGEGARPEQVDAVRHELGLDKPMLSRYGDWLTDTLSGDLGTSYRTKQPVMEAVRERLPVTAEIAVLAVGLALLVSVPLGVAAAYWQDGRFDRVLMTVSTALLSAPSFLVALVLVFFFAVTHHVFPVIGWVPISESVTANLRHATLPVLSLALTEVAVFTRLLRSDMISTLQEEYILIARAKGLRTAPILFRHALRPSSISLITVTGVSLGRIVGGTVIIETIFTIPGIGLYIIQAIDTRDLVAVQGAVLVVALLYVAINTVLELVYARVDPRLAAGGRS